MHKIPEEKINYILSNYKLSSTELSKNTNIPASTIRSIIRKNGINKRKIFSPDKNEFIKKYDELKSSRKLGKYYGVSHKTILYYAKEIGYDNSHTPMLNESQVNEIISKYYTYNASYLAKQFNVSTSLIYNIWFKNGCTGKDNRVYKTPNQDYFSVIDSNDKAYFLGLIGADGCIFHYKDNRQSIIRIELQSNDYKILKLFSKTLDTNKPVNYTSDHKYASIEISSNKLVAEIEKLDIHERKTYSNTIANVSDEFMPHLIRGYFDGDGSVHYSSELSKCSVSISGYKDNLIKIQEFLERCNIFTIFIEDKRKYTTSECGTFGSLSFPNKTSIYCFLKLIYKNCGEYKLDRKFEISNKIIEHIENSNNIRDKQICIYYNNAVQKGC